MAAGDVAAARRAIVNPGTLDRERQLEVCLQCHLEPTSSPLPFQLRRVGRPPMSYVPGTPLAIRSSTSITPRPARSDDPHADKFEIAGAAYRLAKSACFQGSQMTCLTCHDPHDVPRGEAAVKHYTAACQSCHQTVHAAGTPRVAGAGPRATCIDCHMPRRRTEDAVHVVMTDHFIQRVRPARDLTAPLDEATTLAASHYQGEVALYYPPALPPTPDTELYLALAQVQQGSNLAAGIPRLQTGDRGPRVGAHRVLLRARPRLRQGGQPGGGHPLVRGRARPRRRVRSGAQGTGRRGDRAGAVGPRHRGLAAGGHAAAR